MLKYANPFPNVESMIMMNKATFCLIPCLSLTIAAPLALACNYPDTPHIPDGSTASKDDLLAAKANVQSYIAAVDDYLTCLESEEKAAVAAMDNPSSDELQRRDDMLNKKFDAANEQKVLVGEQFNQQIRAYNEKIQQDKE